MSRNSATWSLTCRLWLQMTSSEQDSSGYLGYLLQREEVETSHLFISMELPNTCTYRSINVTFSYKLQLISNISCKIRNQLISMRDHLIHFLFLFNTTE